MPYIFGSKGKTHLKNSGVNKGITRITGNSSFIFIISALMIVFLIVYPSSILILESFGISKGNFENFGFSSYVSIFKNIHTFNAVKNTLIIGAGTTLFALTLGVFLAFLVCRTDFPLKKYVNWMVFMSFVIPHYILGISWIEMFGRNGYFNRIFVYVTGQNTRPFSAYSVISVVIVLGLHLYPIVFMAVSNAIRKGDHSLEEAASISGATRFKVFRDITLPLIMPTVLSIGLFVFSRSIANFGVSALLLVPIYEETLTTRVFYALNDLDLRGASSVSIVLVSISGLVFLIQYFLTKNKNYSSINSNEKNTNTISLGKLKYPLTVFTVLFLFCGSVLPVVSIFASSFLKRWGLPFTFENLTLKNYTDIFTNPKTFNAFSNSIVYGLIASAMAITASLMIVRMTMRSKSRGVKILSFFSSMPMAIPNTVLAIAAILAWNGPPFELYSTPWILIVTFAALFMPICMKNIAGLMEQIDPKLVEAARISGADGFGAMKDIILPMVFPGIKSALIISLLISLREIPISMMLHSSGTETVGVLLFDMRSNSGSYETTSAIAVIIIALCFLGRLFTEKGKKRRKYGKLSERNMQKIRKHSGAERRQFEY